ncbi:energy transducer TonB [Sphingomonas sp. Leaf17]|uniref:energy transducer TonB n=1 Tax=Sphingomonas sp. Leaf17 TaxID=1735683 RepID=UPI0009EC02DC|nr:TonB family protein [Sphingomonas sp. Leaf17]
MRFLHSIDRDRVKAGAAAVLIQGLLVYALVQGLAVGMPGAVEDALKVFAVAPEPPPPPIPKPIPPKVYSSRPEGAAAPPNLRSKATEVVAPVPIIVVPVPPPLIVAPVAATGNQASSGASDRAGPGTGAGGVGNGTGSGGSGDGDGAGDLIPPRWKKGRIKDSDFPKAAAAAGFSGTVEIRFAIEVDGRPSHCVITSSSGNAEVDETTCRLVEERFVYEPAREPNGRPVRVWMVQANDWVNEYTAQDRDRR